MSRIVPRAGRAVGACMLLLAAESPASEVGLAWSPPAVTDGGESARGPVSYRVHYGQASRRYTAVIEAGTGTTCRVTGLDPGTTYYFAVTAYWSPGAESDYSFELTSATPPVRTEASGWTRDEGDPWAVAACQDADGNGLPDGWEKQHFGCPAVADPRADADGDGVPNGAEYVAGTDPTNAASCLRLTAAVDARGERRVAFLAAAAEGAGYWGTHRFYALERRGDPGAGEWTAVPGLQAVTGTNQVVLHQVRDGVTAVYRTRVWLERW